MTEGDVQVWTEAERTKPGNAQGCTVKHIAAVARVLQLYIRYSQAERTAFIKVKQAVNPDSNLTKREIEMLELIAKGMSYEQVADSTGISYGTVRKHLENIYKKLNVHSKLEAVNKAQKDGLL